MIVELNQSQKQEMSERSGDVSDLVQILHELGHKDATRESAFLAWDAHSDSYAASWMMITKDPAGFREVENAHLSLIEKLSPKHEVASQQEVPATSTPSKGRIPSSLQSATLNALEKIGFTPDPNISRSEIQIRRMDHIAGRLDNVAYMANAIDAADGIPLEQRAKNVPGGTKQFQSLLAGSLKDSESMAHCYVALRRAQRAGNDDLVRTGLVLLVAADHNEIGFKDVLTALGDDGIPKNLIHEKENGRASLSSVLKGPADNAPAVAALGAARSSLER